MKRAFIDSRPYLLLSLLFGISYFFLFVLSEPEVPDPLKMLWKGAGVGFLAVYALHRIRGFDGRLIATVMAFGALGDILIELDLILGAFSFLIGHCFAITLYLRLRRPKPAFSQMMFAILLVPVSVFVAWSLPFDRSAAPGFAIYTAFLAVMAAAAWLSDFPRYRVGVGALFFIISDLFIFSSVGFLQDSAIPVWTIWPFYYFGQFLIATGVVRSLRDRVDVVNP